MSELTQVSPQAAVLLKFRLYRSLLTSTLDIHPKSPSLLLTLTALLLLFFFLAAAVHCTLLSLNTSSILRQQITTLF